MSGVTEVLGSAWMVVAATDYEPNLPLAVLQDEQLANAWRDELTVYHESRPPLDANATDEEFEEAYARVEAWREAHPGGELAAGCMEFVVHQIPLRGAASP